MAKRKASHLLLAATILPMSYWAAACSTVLGPGYTIDKQEISVRFVSDAKPVIHVDAQYRLRNTGNRPLSLLELRLPGRRRFRFADPHAEWDSKAVTLEPSQANPRNNQLSLPGPWNMAAVHTLRLSVDFEPAEEGGNNVSFAPDAFFLPAEGWSPELLPARGIFATGGVPPKKWLLTVQVPEGFVVHTGGRKPKASRRGGEQVVRVEQRPQDGYPFVIAGRFHATQLKAEKETIYFWTRADRSGLDLRKAADSLVKSADAYNGMFGSRREESHQLWVVECPVAENCLMASEYTDLISEGNEKPSAHMVSLDTEIVDVSAGAPEITTAAGAALASSWLGYGQNPGFFEQDPPLSALPAFAASQGREALQGHEVRLATIRRALQQVPVSSDAKKPESDEVVRAKSLLFFFGLQDRYGHDVFNKAISHMLYARRGGGFDLDDLIAAFEQETHQNVAEFVRHWMKRPGVPGDFRARYENATSAVARNAKETTP